MNNKKIIFNLNNNQRHIGEYFEIIKYSNKYYLYYGKDNKIYLVVSSNLNFNKSILSKIVIENCPGGVFTIINKSNVFYMLCGCHNSKNEIDEISIPDLVWPKQKRTILNWNVKRKDRSNGMYLLKSLNGIIWEEISEKPVLHSYINSDSCKLGEVCFDTHPCVIKIKDEFYYYGRLNTSLDERRIYLRKSKDLINWSLPEKIIIKNENNNKLKKNYYNFFLFKKDTVLYAFTPYFEACGTINRKCCNGKTLLLKSIDGLNWEIINSYLPHKGKYKDRVNSVLIENDNIKVFYRENCLLSNQNLISYDLIL